MSICKECAAPMQLRQAVGGISYLICSENVPKHRGAKPNPPDSGK